MEHFSSRRVLSRTATCLLLTFSPGLQWMWCPTLRLASYLEKVFLA